MSSLIFSAASRFLQPLLLLLSLFLLVRGHHQPGGGFVGGLVAVAAVALRAAAAGTVAAREELRVRPRLLLAVGLAVALVATFAGPIAGRPPLTGLWTTLPLPGGTLELGTPLLFELGVYLIVIGASLMTLLELAEETGWSG